MSRLKFDWSDVPELYLDKHLSLSQIAKLKGCSTGSVCYTLEKAGIPRRQGPAAKLGRGHNTEKWEDLEYLYNTQKMPVYQIAQIKHSLPRTVRKYLRIANIPIRTYAEAQQLRAEVAGRIRELEAKIKLLERALEDTQLIWWNEN